jgi:NAD(P)-dependent dehydrogenase (short-subunit alcohol dehydrogenase family)
VSRHVLITGTTRGIGRHLAEHYLTLGDTVIGCARGESASAPTATCTTGRTSPIDRLLEGQAVAREATAADVAHVVDFISVASERASDGTGCLPRGYS